MLGMDLDAFRLGFLTTHSSARFKRPSNRQQCSAQLTLPLSTSRNLKGQSLLSLANSAETPKSEQLTVTSTFTGRLCLLKAYCCFSFRRVVDSEHARAILHEVYSSSSRPYIMENNSRESALRNPANDKNKTLLTRHPVSERVCPGSYQHRNSATGYPHRGKNAPKPLKNPNLNHLSLKKVTTVFPFDTELPPRSSLRGWSLHRRPFWSRSSVRLGCCSL